MIYLALTRLDIAFAVGVVTQFMYAPRTPHLEATFRILRYRKFAPRRGLLFFDNGHVRVEVYIDADWARSLIDRRSTLGYCSFVGGNLVTWRSNKEFVVI